MAENDEQPAVFRDPEETAVEHPDGLYSGTVVDGTSEIPGPHAAPTGPGSEFDDGAPEQRPPQQVYEEIDTEGEAEPAVRKTVDPKPGANSGSQSQWAAEHEDPDAQRST